MGQVKLDIRNQECAWPTYLILILFFQLTFYLTPFVCLYAILTLHWPIIAVMLTLSALQHITRRSQIYIHLVNKYIQPLKYFRRFLRIYDEQIDDEETTMFCSTPHSLFSYAPIANINADNSKMSSAILLGSRVVVYTPIIGMQLSLWGLQSADPKNLSRIMEKKRDVILVPGGFQESTLTVPEQLRIYIKNRYGFIKYALRYGYTIRPALVFNEHKGFKTFKYFLKLRLAINKIKIPAAYWYGGFLQLFFPIDLEMVTVVGRGIRRDPKNEGQVITREQVKETHERYIKEVQRLYEAYKGQFNAPKLVIY